MKRPDQIKDAPDLGPESRVPPGQFLTTKFPVLTYGPTPKVKLETWKFKVFGLVEQPLELNWKGSTSFPGPPSPPISIVSPSGAHWITPGRRPAGTPAVTG